MDGGRQDGRTLEDDVLQELLVVCQPTCPREGGGFVAERQRRSGGNSSTAAAARSGDDDDDDDDNADESAAWCCFGADAVMAESGRGGGTAANSTAKCLNAAAVLAVGLHREDAFFALACCNGRWGLAFHYYNTGRGASGETD